MKRNLCLFFVVFSILLQAPYAGAGIDKGENVCSVSIEGNQRIEDAAILRMISTRAGDTYDPARVSDDLKSVFKMGYFEDVRVESEESDGCVKVFFVVKERPTIRQIDISGNTVFEDSEILENISLEPGAIANIHRIKQDIRAIETMYKEKNYYNVHVTYSLEDKGNNTADLEFKVSEGEKVRVTKIIIEGNSAYDDDTLKDLMETEEAGFFSWLTGSGDLDPELLSQDIEKIRSFYKNHGFADARVADPVIEYKKDGIRIVIKVEEGPRYRIGKIDFAGDLIEDKAKLFDLIHIDEEKFFNQKVLQNDVITISDLYADQGYAKADVIPQMRRTRPGHGEDGKEKAPEINITFYIRKGVLVTFERIEIGGNEKTRDKVIRRQLHVAEGDKYSVTKLRRSIQNLYRLDYFEDIKVKSEPGSSDDKMVLHINVKEKPTGTFSFGAGYSAVDKLYVMASVSERNFLGRGQTIDLSLQTGSQSRQFRFGFTEPWLFDIPLSAGIEAYNWTRDYDEYERDSKGGGITLGYPVADYTRVYLTYSYDSSRISNVMDGLDYLITEGRETESSLALALVYDTRNRVINPTEGSRHKASVQYAGLGGSIGFIKTLVELGHYFPLFWSTSLFLHAEAGYAYETKYLPDYEKFYLGGLSTLRGFDWRGVTAYEDNEEKNEIGGEKYVLGNVEFIFPIIKEAGLTGLVFYDTGNVYRKDQRIDLGNLRQSAGFGIRWYSPLGPMRLERGYILDRRKDDEGHYIEDSGRWEFAIGGAY